MTKTGRRDESIDFWRKWRNSGFVANFFDEICTFWQMALLVAKCFGA